MRLLWILFVLSLCLTGCSVKKEEGSWNPLDYEEQEDIISIKDMTDVVREMTDHAENITIYKVRYKSDDCEVVSYLGIPNQCLLQKEAYPCIIYNRGGNRAFGEISPKTIAEATTSFNCIVLQFRAEKQDAK